MGGRARLTVIPTRRTPANWRLNWVVDSVRGASNTHRVGGINFSQNFPSFGGACRTGEFFASVHPVIVINKVAAGVGWPHLVVSDVQQAIFGLDTDGLPGQVHADMVNVADVVVVADPVVKVVELVGHRCRTHWRPGVEGGVGK
ncbi:MAG: hypothetical protein ACT4OM_12730 [Actinomycetota bacterium]